MRHHLALRNFLGEITKVYEYERAIPPAAPAKVRMPSHHIAVLDVSGSMYGDLPSVRSIVEKVFTAQEFTDPSMLITLLSYASNGDCRMHFHRRTVAEVMAPGSTHLQEIRNLTTRGLTGISQALRHAEKLIDDKEITAISLHTDGYANDPSPFQEHKAILELCDKIAQHPNTFCNTVGYRSYCDYPLLTTIALKLSGKAIHATSAAEVYAALHGVQIQLAGSMAPAVEAAKGDASFVAVVSRSARKVVGGTESVVARGLSASDDVAIYRLWEIPKERYDITRNTGPTANLVFSRLMLGLGRYNQAKYALVDLRWEDMLVKHARALTAPQITDMIQDVEHELFDTTGVHMRSDGYGLPNLHLPTVPEVLGMIGRYAQGTEIAIPSGTYKRRGLKRVPGVRVDGAYVAPKYRLKIKGGTAGFTPVSGVEFNRTNATINLRVVQDGELHTDAGLRVAAVGGVKLDLKDFKMYTVVGDGDVNLGALMLQSTDKRLVRWLKDKIFRGAEVAYPAGTQELFTIPLDYLPVASYTQVPLAPPATAVQQLLELTVVQKLLGALLKSSSVRYTDEQILALKEHCVTPAGYFSGPTTTPYADLTKAVEMGEVDVRVSTSVEFGTTEILGTQDLYSGNEYLQRRFVASFGLELIAKPTMLDWWRTGVVFGEKKLSARTTLGPVDELTYSIYQQFLGMTEPTALISLFYMSIGPEFNPTNFTMACGKKFLPETTVEIFTDVARQVDQAIERVYQDYLQPLSFYVGATGMLPDNLECPPLTADQAAVKYPQLKLGKGEQEAYFYEVGPGVLMTVKKTSSYYSTAKGVEAAKALLAGSGLSPED